MIILCIIGLISIIGLIALIIWLFLLLRGTPEEPPERRAGKSGEKYASRIIDEVLRESDKHLTNVLITADGKQAELDNVIINRNGVFIIEVKNYTGELHGDEEDYEWLKYKYTSSSVPFQKVVKNPIPQVKRQVYILSKLLKKHNINVWIEGYVFFVERNSPVNSCYVLWTQEDIDRAIHQNQEIIC